MFCTATVLSVPQFAYALNQSDISYGPHPSQSLDICTPATGSPPKGTVILIHGGGWTGGDKASLSSLCRRLSKQGLVALNINYHLVDGSPESAWPAQLNDVKKAIVWANSQSGFPHRYCLMGFSAGAHLAIKAAEKDFSGTGVTFPIECVVDNFGPTIFKKGSILWAATCRLVNETDDSECSRKAKMLEPGPPGTGISYLLVHGRSDGLVPVTDSEELLARYKEHGVSVELVIYDGDHSYKGLPLPKTELLIQRQIDFIAKAMR